MTYSIAERFGLLLLRRYLSDHFFGTRIIYGDLTVLVLTLECNEKIFLSECFVLLPFDTTLSIKELFQSINAVSTFLMLNMIRMFLKKISKVSPETTVTYCTV